MLIPLSVLVGILLSHRQGAQTALELNIGAIVAMVWDWLSIVDWPLLRPGRCSPSTSRRSQLVTS